MPPFKTLSEANEAYASLAEKHGQAASTIETLTTERDVARQQAQTNFTNLKAAQQELADVQVKLTEATTNAETLTGQLNTEKEAHQATKDQHVKNINSEVQRALAASGHAPVEGEVTTEQQSAPKKDFSHLSGLEKSIAAHKAKYSNPG